MKILDVIILAAGHGKRMYSMLPKVLHELAGKPLLQYVVETAQGLDPHTIYVVYGNGGQKVPKRLNDLSVCWIKQEKLLGTGHAVKQAISSIKREGNQVLILLGDTPLVSLGILQKLIQSTVANRLGLVTLITQQPFGLGRILRNQQGEVIQIVEEKEASREQRKIQEVNSGIFYLSAKLLKRWLPKLEKNNAQAEYYLTDIIAMAVQEGIGITTITADTEGEMQGVNDRVQLAKLERYYQRQQAQRLMLQGLTLLDPDRFDLRGKLTMGKDVVIDINVLLKGKNHIGMSSFVGPHTTLKNTKIGCNVIIQGYCMIENAVIGDNCIIGPFARIRPGTTLKDSVHIGNFVEVKDSQIDRATKISHLSYIGNADIGKDVNIGAGTITCNYDGAVKHKTKIADDVFIGSNTALIAPIRVAKSATIGAGSTLSKDVPARHLTISRSEARTIKNWKRPVRNETQ